MAKPDERFDMIKTSATERFWLKVDRGADDECWLWRSTITGGGYGYFNRGNRENVPAHRYAYELLVGPIEEGLQIDHLCRVRHCVNPAHLEPVTQRVNVLRGISPSARAARQSTCLNGHDLNDPANVYQDIPSRPNTRTCKPCAVSRARAYRRARARERAMAG